MRLGAYWVFAICSSVGCSSTDDNAVGGMGATCQVDSDCPYGAAVAECVAGVCRFRDGGTVIPTDGGSGSGGTAGTTCDAGGCPATSGSLAGTWEVLGSRVGDVQRSALVTVTAGSLVVDEWRGTFQAILHGNTFDVSFVGTNGAHFQFSAAHTPGPGSAGIIPLPLFGDWDAHAANTPGCTISAKPDLASADCTRADALPSWMARNGTATLRATRTSSLASEFGDFGGNWTFSTALGASCTIKVEGNTISAECTNAGEATGSATFTLTGDSGRGSTSKGIEFTAQRR